MAILGRKQKEDLSESRVLDVTAAMEGSLIFQEPVSLRISGRFKGNLETRGDLTIGEKAFVEADIIGESITVAGKVTGKVVAKQNLRVIPPAVLRGRMVTPVLEVEKGAHLEGTLEMTEASLRSAQEEGQWMTLKEVAEYLEVEARLVEQWAREGKISGTKQGEEWRFEKGKIDDWVAAQKSS